MNKMTNVKQLTNLIPPQSHRRKNTDNRQKTHLHKGTFECAKSMIALNQKVCCVCLGTRTVLKTKKNVRYSTVCRACVEN